MELTLKRYISDRAGVPAVGIQAGKADRSCPGRPGSCQDGRGGERQQGEEVIMVGTKVGPGPGQSGQDIPRTQSPLSLLPSHHNQ